MKKKIYYWSPCLTKIGTIKSTINSAVAMANYGKVKYDVYLINSCGEWDDYIDYLKDKNVNLINFRFRIFKYLPKNGFLKSRISYILIYLFSFFPLLKLLKKNKPDFLIAHLITSLPLTLLKFFKFETEFILRISGMPKLNLFRKNLWKSLNKKLKIITCPTNELKNQLINNNIFDSNKILYLQDAILNMEEFVQNSKLNDVNIPYADDKKIIFAAGRLTRQKNFSYLIDEFNNFSENNDYILIIIGDGEEKDKLKKIIERNKLENKVFLIGYVKNIFKYFLKGNLFILSSLWEEVGFVLVEAAMSNLFIISSDCPNGPKEFLNFGKNGILFKNNIPGELTKSLTDYNRRLNFKSDLYALKKNAMKYTKFRHFTVLDKIICQ